MTVHRVIAAIMATGALALGAAACGEDDPPAAAAGGGGEQQALAGATFKVGSKDFAEQYVLGHITMQVLEANGAEVEDKTNIVGSDNTRKALLGGDIDVYWEYTGTGWVTYLKETKPIADPAEQYEAVRDADLEKNQVVWAQPAGLNNTYALAVKRSTAEELGVSTLSDLAALAERDPSKATICVEAEFQGRDDGLPGLLEHYGIDIPRDNVKTLDTGLIYTATEKGEDCTFGEVFATDGRTEALDLLVLEDDKQFFPVYQAAPTLRKETADQHPQVAELLAPVAEKLTDDVMRGLNAKVDVDGEQPEDVAREWLESEGLLQ